MKERIINIILGTILALSLVIITIGLAASIVWACKTLGLSLT